MASKHRHWQSRWQVDPSTGIALHENGLRVRIEDGRGAAMNAPDIVEVLTPAHGAHNAQAMVLRLVREGAQLLIDPFARGWRNTPGG